jgi:uncharacterized protein YbjT (DUF2867 family)
MTELVVGATGSVGRLVVEEAIRQGHAVRALARSPARPTGFPLKHRWSVVTSRVRTRFPGATDGVGPIVLTLGSE